MKKMLVAVLILSAIYSQSHAQGVERQLGTSSSASQLFLEAGGLGLAYSVNYDQRFKKEENGFGFRAGIGGAGSNGSGYFAVPVQINYLYGNNGQYLELGAGASFFSLTGTDFFSSSNSNTYSTVLATATIGFRKVPFGKKGLTWRVAFDPFIGEGGFTPWFGASLGYRF